MAPAARERVYVALGSNLGDRSAQLQRARQALAALPGTTLIATSSVEETAPLAGMDQPPYLNQMVLLETALTPRALLEAGQAIEQGAGRVRTARWGPRTLDIDIVRFGDRPPSWRAGRARSAGVAQTSCRSAIIRLQLRHLS